MTKTLRKKELIELLTGATFLASGGGGSLKHGLALLEKLEKEEELVLNLNDVADMEKDDYAGMAAAMGSPIAMEESDMDFDDVVNAFIGLQDELRREGKNMKYIYSGEYGGLNTCVAIYIAIKTDTPLLDLDGNIRAVPELNTGLLVINGYPPYPVVLANTAGDKIVVRTADPNNSKEAENISRQLSTLYGMKIGFATWAISKKTIKEILIPGTLSHAWKAGELLLSLKKTKGDIVETLSEITQIREITRGRVIDIEVNSEGGFDYGTTVISSDTEIFKVPFKNENIAVINEKEEVVITVPETITMIDLDTYEPLTNSDVVVGMNVAVFAIPAMKPWWSNPLGFECWSHILESIKIPLKPVRY